MIDVNKAIKRIAKKIVEPVNPSCAERLVEYVKKQWFCPSTPILHNSGEKHGFPISCFVNHVGDSMESIRERYNESFEYARFGGGVGTYWGDVRENGASIRGKTHQHRGVIPFMSIQDRMAIAVNQTNVRNGSTAVYLPVWHGDIEIFLDLRRHTGDLNNRCLNLHHGVIIDDRFMNAVVNNEAYSLLDVVNKEPIREIVARELWQKILTTRIETGEPFIVFIDTVNKNLPVFNTSYEKVYTSNLCSEILQPTSEDKPAVCCLASVNLEKWLEYHLYLDQVVEDVLLMLDCVLNEFVEKAKDNKTLENTVKSVQEYRAVGLGVMGFYSFLQSLNIPFDSVMSKAWNKKIFSTLKQACDKANHELGVKYGFALRTKYSDEPRRFSFTQAIAPTATISRHFNTSPSIDPLLSNVFNEKTQSGNRQVKNKYLKELLIKKVGEDKARKEWKDIQANNGSVSSCEALGAEKDVFKTAYEIPQQWIIELAGERAPYIDQGQSVNLFFPSNVDKGVLNKTHIEAWRKGVKSLYYCRSMAEERAQTVGQESYKECLACQ